MIRSMTGFGDASSQVDGIHYSVEVRSLNNRYFKASVRLPDEIASLEAELETQLRKRVFRGSVTLVLKYRISDDNATQQINDSALMAYLDHLETIHEKVKDDQAVNIDLTALLALPGVLKPTVAEEDLLDRVRPVVQKLADEACDRLTEMRIAEGKLLAEDLMKHCEKLQGHLEIIRDRAPVVVEEYHARLKTRVDDLLARAQLNVNEQDLLREVAVFAERSDISEEINRLDGHIQQFGKIVSGENSEPIGRTLDFIAQEMLREANTIASKCNDATISQETVQVKGAIDRIKEQVQNAE